MNRSRHVPPDAAVAAPDESHAGFVRRPIRRFRSGKVTQLTDAIAEEVPIALVYNDRPHVVMMATPRDLDDFALGFSLSEAVIGAADEFEWVGTQTLLEGIEVRLRIPASARRSARIAPSQSHRPHELRPVRRAGARRCGAPAAEGRHGATRSMRTSCSARSRSCTICSRSTSRPARRTRRRGCVSTAKSRCLREDVGRHNALDKLIGAMTKSHERVDDGFLVVTSRASYEMVQKSATVGIALLAAISAPTALAIHLAEETGMTLIGFARPEGHVVYANPQRIMRASTGIPA